MTTSHNDSLIRVLAVTCPRHGDKVGFQKPDGSLAPFPFLADADAIQRATPLCFECHAVGIRRRCIVRYEPAGEI